MSASRRPPSQRTHLGSPIISVSRSPRYLRQRMAAEKERKARRDRKWRLRVWLAGLALAFYFVIGRDLLGMTRGLGQAAATSVRKDAHDVAVALKKAAEMREEDRLVLSPSPVDFDAPDVSEYLDEDASNPDADRGSGDWQIERRGP